MKKSFVIALNLGYWILYFLLLVIILLFLGAGGVKNITEKQEVIFSFFRFMSLVTIVPGLLSFYTFYLFLFDRFLAKKKIARLCLAGCCTVVLAGFTGFLGMNMLASVSLFQYNEVGNILLIVLFLSLLSLVHGIIALVMKGFISWYGDIKIKEELKEKNFKTELALVKLQLSPHFLFNTINNIDVLIEKDPVKASSYLNKLSDIMRFMLYETKTEDIPLIQELAYISKYIDLQKIRNANAAFVQYKLTGSAGSTRIAPMLFIPFIENAFKHAANKKKENGIVIEIDISGTGLHFYCKNDLAINPLLKEEAGGLGNGLIRKRLDLLYPGQYQLDISKDAAHYEVRLMINRTAQNVDS